MLLRPSIYSCYDIAPLGLLCIPLGRGVPKGRGGILLLLMSHQWSDCSSSKAETILFDTLGAIARRAKPRRESTIYNSPPRLCLVSTGLRSVCTRLRSVCTRLRSVCTRLRSVSTRLRSVSTRLRSRHHTFYVNIDV